MHVTVDQILRELDDATAKMHRLADPLSEDQLNRRPAPERWSVGECLLHLITTNDAYIPALQQAKQRARGAKSDSYEIGWFASWFVRSLEPPPKKKFKAPQVFLPKKQLVTRDVIADFEKKNAELKELLTQWRGVDLMTRVTSPATKLLRLPMIAAFATITTHERRHLWQAEQVLTQ